MIARVWRGATRAADAEAYVEYVRETGLAGYRRTPGNRGSLLLYQINGATAEFVVVSLWESREAIVAFAGDDISEARFYPDDDRFLVDRDLTASHYVVADATLAPGGGS